MRRPAPLVAIDGNATGCRVEWPRPWRRRSAERLERRLELAGQFPGVVPLVGRGDELDVVAPGPALDVDVAHVDPAAVDVRLVFEHHGALVAGVGLVLLVADLAEAIEVLRRPGSVVAGRLGQGVGGVGRADGEHPPWVVPFLDHRGVEALPGPGPEARGHSDAVAAGTVG